MIFNLRPISIDDSDILYIWANDSGTREASFNTRAIEKEEHELYMESILKSKTNNQFILEIDGIGVGTIKDSIKEGVTEMNYTVSPDYRGKRISSLMMSIYLHNRKGKFLCRIKETNIPSIKMVERCGFILSDKVDEVLHYNIVR